MWTLLKGLDLLCLLINRLLPSNKLPSPFTGSTLLSNKLAELASSTKPISPLVQLASGPFRNLLPGKSTRRTQLMSILNLTPDSFSDGGDLLPSNSPLGSDYQLSVLSEMILKQVKKGAMIVDIGGQSTRPHAPQISAETEWQRIKPALDVIAAMPKDVRALFAVSIDTYRADVAEAAIQAGADIINDVSAGQLDPNMFKTIARLGCTYVMMHMRGTPDTMTNKEHTDYSITGGVVKGVATELAHRVEEAEDAGIRRWRMILDPGIGFAKNRGQNLVLLRCLGALRGQPDPRTGRPLHLNPSVLRRLDGIPWLVGTSRKGFIGKITGVESPRKRVHGTAAAVTAAVQGGADIVRVHDVEEMRQVVDVADAIWRIA